MADSGAVEAFRYRAFISYSHRDRAAAAWIHRAVETYRLPPKLVGAATPVGPVPRRLTPVFRDRDELAASGDLAAALTAALRQSRFLVVVCSPAAAVSHWVNEEILTFKRTHGESRVLGLIVAGEPYASAIPGRDAEECFPPAMRLRMGADGLLSDVPAEPIAADCRASADGRRTARMKIVAGLAGLSLDDLVQRETQRRVRRLAVLSVASLAGMVFAGGLALYANQRRIEADHQRHIAETESAAARAAADYLVGTFELANPATENPRTITALSILARSADRARVELRGQPVIQSRLLDTVGRAYNNLGLLNEARAALERARPTLIAAGADGAPALLTLAVTNLKLGRFDQARAAVADAKRGLARDPAGRPDISARAEDISGQIMIAAVDHRGALAAYNRAARLCDTVPKIPTATCASIRANRGSLLSELGRYKEAEISLMAAYAGFRDAYGPRDRRTGESELVLAQSALGAGDLTAADRWMTASLDVLRPVLEPGSLILADALSTEGQIYQAQGRLAPAKAALEQAIAAYRRHFPGYHYLIGINDVYLALVESDLGRSAIALGLLDDAKRNYDASYGKLNPNHGDLLVNRAKVLAKMGRRREALADCGAGLAILAATLGPDAAYTKTMGKTCDAIKGAPSRTVSG
ncbi:MAG: tetratricopeptide repeat protein [Caulobacteraceae bacterium]